MFKNKDVHCTNVLKCTMLVFLCFIGDINGPAKIALEFFFNSTELHHIDVN